MIFILMIALAVSARLIPHMPNFAPIAAIAIFGALYLPGRKALVATLGSRVISDIILGFFGWKMMIAVYTSHALTVGLGVIAKRFSIKASSRWVNVFAAAVAGLASALVFFLITNFAFLYTAYPHTLQGIILAYANGLPFLRGTILGDVGYSVALVGGFELVRWGYFKIQDRRKLVFT